MRKKLLTTLALLLMAVSGAWAAFYLDMSGTSATMMYSTKSADYSGKPYYSGGRWYNSGSVNTVQTITVDASCTNFNGSSLEEMFSGFTALTTVTGLGNINTTNVTNMSCMFFGCTGLTSLDLSGLSTSSVTNMSCMFQNCSSLTSLDLSGLSTSSVTNMNCMFQNCSSLTSLDLSNWNTSSVTSMSRMFMGCTGLTSLDLSNWNTSSITTVNQMFQNCSQLTAIYVGNGWSLPITAIVYQMFDGCTSLPNWDGTIGSTHANTGADGYLNKVKVTAHEGEMGEYWATYYNGTRGFTADANTIVYQAAVNTGKTAVVLTKVTGGEVPAGNGVVLKSSASSIVLSVATTTATMLAGNELLGTDAALSTPANAYCLSKETSGSSPRGVGFYTYTLATIPANRAYLEVPGGPTTARGFLGFSDDDNTTDIEAIDHSPLTIDHSVYDLSGRLVTGQPQKGIYVKNGKKVVIK